VAEAFAGCSLEHQFFLQGKADELLSILSAVADVSSMSVLDIGCGIGLMERLLGDRVGHLAGTDVSVAAVRTAAATVDCASFLAYDGLSLPFANGTFDAAFAVCVLHHVPPDDWAAVVREMSRVIRPGGALVVFEHNPWNPATRVVVSRCEFDRGVTLLSPRVLRRLLRGARLRAPAPRFLFFFPWKGRLWRALERGLRLLPLGAQHVVTGIVPAPAGADDRGGRSSE
jgi:SAM-dependent methyltransferase